MMVPRKWNNGTRGMCVALLAILPAAPLSAERHSTPPDAGGSSGGNAPKSAFDTQEANLEKDLAAMLEQRAQGSTPVLEFQIDMHVLARWLAELGDNAPAMSRLQAAAYLRSVEVLNCATMLSGKLNASPITAEQTDGLARLHKMTFKLPEVKEVGQLDDFCKNAAIALIAASGPLPAGIHELPLMRPKPMEDHSAGAQPPPAPRTLAQLVDDANHAEVSPPLRAQLVALASAANSAANDPTTGEEAATLSKMLQQVMDLVAGLQTNVGVSSDDRAKMEHDLTDGVALFADPRTRSAGREKLQALDEYRHTLERIRKLNLSPDLSAKFAPAFVFVSQNAEAGSQVMDGIEKWLSLTGQFDNHAPPPGMTSNQTRVIEAMQKDYATQRDAFLADAGNLNAGPGAANPVGPTDLLAHLPKMEDAIDTTHLVERANIAVNALLAFHPRPTGGLEHRVNVAVGTIAEDLHLSPDRMTQREQDKQQEAVHFLGDLERLAQSAADVSTGSAGIPDAVAQNWAGGKLADFDSKRTDLITALASQAASGKDIDSTTLDRLDQAKGLVSGLHDAAAVQTALDQLQPLSHWADWTIAPADLQTILQPVRDASSAAVAGFINDDDDAIKQWTAARDHYAPLLHLVSSAGAYADQCKALPGDLVGEMAKLATPMDGQPFAEERFASLCIGLWSAYNQVPDAGDADAMVQALLKPGK